MQVPEVWVDELARALAPDAFLPIPPIRLALTYRRGLPDRLAEVNLVLQEVIDDLRRGYTSQRRGRPENEYYCLSTSRFDVFVRTEPVEGGCAPLAVVTSVKPVKRLACRDGGTGTTAVSEHLPTEEETCDIATVHELLEERRRQHARRERAAERAAGLVARPRDSSRDSELHSKVLRQYSALLTVVDLLRERYENDGRVEVGGTVVAPDEVAAVADGPLLCVQLDRVDSVFRPGVEVSVRKWRLEIVLAEDTLLCLEPPERDELEPGQRVVVRYQESFRLGKHSFALNRFLDQDVVGNWTALAHLLHSPKSLAIPQNRSALTFFNPDLNPAQRKAVTGAVDAPQAYFVQGPPGTGKTTVITELVRQLVSRGERVLLVASMHVAVDEVLRRAADADGVFALRYSADDSRVRADLRRFMPDNVLAEFAAKATRPSRSKVERWQAEVEQLTGEEAWLRGLVEARTEVVTTEHRHADALRVRTAWMAAHAAETAAATTAAARAAQQAEHARMRWSHAWQIEQELAWRVEQARAGQTFWSRIAALFGRGVLNPLIREHSAAWQAAAAARGHDEESVRTSQQATAHRQALVARGATLQREHDQALDHTGAEAVRARHHLADAEAAVGRILPGTDTANVPADDLIAHADQRAARITRLGHYVHLERRWHELAGLTGPQADIDHALTTIGDELIQAANLVCCTSTGFGGLPEVRDSDFDTLIVDEASRVVDSEFLISARQARRWILVGDEHQLPPYVHAPDEHHLHALAALHAVKRGAAPSLPAAVSQLGTLWREDEELHRFRTESVERTAQRMRDKNTWRQIYQPVFEKAYERLRRDDGDAERTLLAAMRTHLVRSLFERCVQECPEGLRVRLREQRRMIDPIAAIVRKPVYDGDYVSPPEADLRKHGVTPLVGQTLTAPVVLLDTSDQPSGRALETQRGTGFINELEADWVVTVCRMWERELRDRGETERVSVSVLTPYGAQAKLLRSRLGHPGYRDFRMLRFEKVDSIDAIQGQESDLVLISFCRARPQRSKLGEGFGLWLQDVRRLNVAVTRARRSLVLVGHRDTLARLSGVDDAKRFYEHLFGLFDRNSAGTVVLKRIREGG
jgi:hypothetical protein